MRETIDNEICWNATISCDSKGKMTRHYTVGFEEGTVICADVTIDVAKKLAKVLRNIIDYDSKTQYNGNMCVSEEEAQYGL